MYFTRKKRKKIRKESGPLHGSGMECMLRHQLMFTTIYRVPYIMFFMKVAFCLFSVLIETGTLFHI